MVQSIDRAMHIVQLLLSGNTRSGWAISDISERVGLPLSTTHRLISSMMEHGLVTQIPDTKRYKTGSRWMEVGLQQLEESDMRLAARPIMEQLADEVKETVFLSMPYGLYSMGVDKVESQTKLRVVENLGERIAMHIGAPNKAMLASMDPREAEAILIRLIDDTNKRNELLQTLPSIKQAGYCVSYAELTEGTVAISSPIMGFGRKVEGAIGIGVVSYQLTDERVAFLGKLVTHAALEISNRIGG
ncbi:MULTISPECIES: IclR family transcriptional regulator [Paenibacillus]|uniref:IclR family transcriptional regulator n=1 Tax=Paenibacillus xylanilyticus TaxID=248903 RepID=A0A7Y6BTH9_9BACL|nr:IclR family transcriptional regulator [Paenibacillus xylanilyticus]NUU74564.1 IclR family transcriptional regulator [Paenibacillus xylanilyticus]